MQTYEQERYQSESIAQRVRRELADARAGVEKTHRYISEDLPFLFDLEQYQRTSARERRGDVIQPVDSQPYENWRHRKGVALQNAPIHIRCEPVDKDSDLLKAEAFKHRLNYQLNGNRFVNYAEVRERWIGGALAARVWAYRWDFVPYLGAYGEVIPRLVDPRMLFIPDGYLSPHDPLCPRMHEVFRIPINEARRLGGNDPGDWKHTDDLKPDRGEQILDWIQTSGGTTRGDGLFFGNDQRDDGGLGGDGMATFCMTWYRFEDEAARVERDIPLDPGQRYLKCSLCDWQSPREYELAEMMDDPGYTLPGQEECAKCGAMMKRVSTDKKSDEQMRYEQGKRLVITCLNGSVEEAMYDGPWPCADCPTFPYAWLTCEKEPHRLIPESDVSTGRNMTIGRNFTLATIYEQAHSSRAVMLFPRRGIEDANGMALDDMDSLADVLFYTSDLPPDGVKVVQGKPVNAALFDLYNILSTVSDKNESSSRVSIGPGETKDIPVGTMKQMIDSGNVPNNMFIQAIYAAESISFTNLSCYLRKFDTEQRHVRFRGKTGKLEWALIRGIDMPDVDVVCSAGPVLSNVRQEEIQAVQDLAAMPPALRRIAGRSMGIDETLMDELDEAQKEMAAMMPSAPGKPGAPKPPAPQPQMNGVAA